MTDTLAGSEDRLWTYLIIPVIVLQLASTLAYGMYFALAAVRPDLANSVPAGQATFGLYVLIAVVEWSLALSIIRRLRGAGGSWMELVAPGGAPWRFRWLPAALMFAGLNAHHRRDDDRACSPPRRFARILIL